MAHKTFGKIRNERIIFSLSRIEDLIYGMTYNPSSNSGKIVANIALIDSNHMNNILPIFRDVMISGLTVSPMVKILNPGESVGSLVIPTNKHGIATVCSITIDGILIKQGIPVKPRFGGLGWQDPCQPQGNYYESDGYGRRNTA